MDLRELECCIENSKFKLASKLSNGKLNKFCSYVGDRNTIEDIYAIYDKSTLFKINGMVITKKGLYIINGETIYFKNLVKVLEEEDNVVIYTKEKEKRGHHHHIPFADKTEKSMVFDILNHIVTYKNSLNSVFRKPKIDKNQSLKNGEECFKDYKYVMAAYHYRKSARMGDTLSCERLAYINFFKNDTLHTNCYREALKWANIGIERKSEACITIKACMYFRGIFGHAHIEEGKKTLFERASKNDELAISYLINEVAYYKKDITINEYKTLISYATKNTNYTKYLPLLETKLEALVNGYDYYQKYSIDNINKLIEAGNVTELKEIIDYTLNTKYYPDDNYYYKLYNAAKYIESTDNNYNKSYNFCTTFMSLQLESDLYDEGCSYYFDKEYDKARNFS